MGTLWTRLANRVLDPSIVFSFDRTGYKRHRAEFTPEDLDAPMLGRVCLVTGGNSGLGLATARALAEREACVWLLCRNRERGNRAVQQIIAETGNTDVHLGLVDVSSLESVRSFCNRFEGDRVDVLIHNAGILPPERLDTEDGLESTLATHLVGPYLMTQLLLPLLAKGDRARVIWVSSGGMYTQRLNTGNWKTRPSRLTVCWPTLEPNEAPSPSIGFGRKRCWSMASPATPCIPDGPTHRASKNPSPDFGKSPKRF